MNWQKQGQIFAAAGQSWWCQRYATLPTPLLLDANTIRIYFYSMTQENHDGRIGYIEVEAEDPQKIKQLSQEPVLEPGLPGCFDDCGVCSSCALLENNRVLMYYTGVQRLEKLPYVYFSGLAIGELDGPMQRKQATPLIERGGHDLFLASAPMVLKTAESWHLYYNSSSQWLQVKERAYPRYSVRHAVSKDGLSWHKSAKEMLPLQEGEFGLARPWVLRQKNNYYMWYSVRSESRPYYIGMAQSVDGLSWQRQDGQVGIAASEQGWDSEMICYASVLPYKDRFYMFYNGNGHGQGGFGYAVAEGL